MRRAISFRVAAILIGISPLIGAELFLALMGWGSPDVSEDPFLGFRGVRPLFVLNDEKTDYEIPLARQKFFRPESFAAIKPPDEFRIFCLGGSTVQGRPFALETSFTTFLELGLNSLDPSRRWQVINCGGVSYASYRLVPILEEILANYKPDLIIVYTGHNEFLEDRTYAHIKHRPIILHESHRFVSGLRTFNVIREQYLRMRGESVDQLIAARPQLGAEVDALLDYRGGLAEYHWDAGWRHGVVDHYESNLQRMVMMCEDRGVPLWLVNPVSNLRDCPPFKSETDETLSADQQQRAAALWAEARSAYRHDLNSAIELLRAAVAIDSRHPGLRYELAKSLDSLGKYDEARSEYLWAKDHDVCPLRMLESMHDSLNRVARRTETPLIDARAMFEAACRNRIPGGFLLVDHVHPSIRGHQMIAGLIHERLVHERWTQGDWATCEPVLQAYLVELPDTYYIQGQSRLKALREWTQGKSPLEKEIPP